MAQEYYLALWRRNERSLTVLMGTSLLFGLLWPFSLFMHFFTSLMKLVLGLRFHRQKDKLKMSGVGNGRGSRLRFTYLLLFGWVSLSSECLSDHSDEIGSPRDALCSFSWEGNPFTGCAVTGVLPQSLNLLSLSLQLSAAGRMAEACGLMTQWKVSGSRCCLSGEWMETSLQGWREGAWTSRLWGHRGGSYQTITQFRRVQEGSQEEVALEGLLKNDWGSSEEWLGKY